METVLSVQIEELTRLQEEEHQRLCKVFQENDGLLSQVKECKCIEYVTSRLIGSKR